MFGSPLQLKEQEQINRLWVKYWSVAHLPKSRPLCSDQKEKEGPQKSISQSNLGLSALMVRRWGPLKGNQRKVGKPPIFGRFALLETTSKLLTSAEAMPFLLPNSWIGFFILDPNPGFQPVFNPNSRIVSFPSGFNPSLQTSTLCRPTSVALASAWPSILRTGEPSTSRKWPC